MKLPKHAKEALRLWGVRWALVIPTWSDADVVGMWVITKSNACYLPFTDEINYPAAFAMVPSIHDDTVVVVDDILAALRMSVWSVLETGRCHGFVVPYGLNDRAELYSCGKTVFWSVTRNLSWLMRAISTPTAAILDSKLIGDFDPLESYPCRGSFVQFKRLVSEALPAHQQLAADLTSLKKSEARSMLSGASFEPGEKAKMLAYVQGSDSIFLSQLFDDEVDTVAVTWDGETIYDTEEGWRLPGGKVIASAKLFIDQIHAASDANEALVRGSIVFNKRSYIFREKLGIIQENPAKWITNYLVGIGASGGIPYFDMKWKKKLIEVAQQFQEPEVISEAQGYGWRGPEDRKYLRMPSFVVDSTGVHPTAGLMEGPALVLPHPLSSREWSAFRSMSFARLVLVFLGTMVRTRQGFPGFGIMLTNEPHVIARIAYTISADVVSCPSNEYIDQHLFDPLPLFTEWNEQSIPKIFEKRGMKNIMLSVDSHTAEVSKIYTDWVHLRIGDIVDYQALRAVFLLLPKLLHDDKIDPASPEFFKRIAASLQAELDESCDGHQLLMAASQLDHYCSCRNQFTSASRLLEFIFYGIERDFITPRIEDDGVVILHEEFLAATSSTLVPVPSLSELTETFSEARFLVPDRKPRSAWKISRTTWDVNQTLIAAR